MKKYIEFGFGNRYLVRTEFERPDGTEYEVKGISGKIQFQSVYLRVWLGQTVYILDSKSGLKRQVKDRKAYKIIVGLVSDWQGEIGT